LATLSFVSRQRWFSENIGRRLGLKIELILQKEETGIRIGL
jgi:hypothetical protein